MLRIDALEVAGGHHLAPARGAVDSIAEVQFLIHSRQLAELGREAYHDCQAQASCYDLILNL